MTALNTKPQSKGWTPERRAKHAAAIRRWKPWTKSTGPRTAAGKARATQNATKPHNSPDRIVRAALRTHARYLTDLNRYLGLKKNPVQNELLKAQARTLRRSLLRRGPKVAAELEYALAYAKLCKNLDFGPPFPLKVNANENRTP